MKKLFIKFSMLLFVLGVSTNVAWADMSDVASIASQLPSEAITALTSATYCAQLTGQASSTGGGKVYVTAPALGQSSTDDPRGGEYEEGVSNVAVAGMGVSMAGMTKIGIIAWAEAAPGYWHAGWSYSNMGTELGTKSDESAPEGMYSALYEVATAPNETLEHVIYATFEPIRFAGYTISGDNSTSKPEDIRYCEQTVIFTMEGTEIGDEDFKAPVVTSVVGGGSWTSADGDEWTTADLTIEGNNVSLVVKFTAPDDAVAEYSANLVMETQAGVKITVLLNARTKETADVEAILYNKNKVKLDQGDLSAIIAAAGSTDVVKLNKNIDHQVFINNSVTLDLNGYYIEHHFNDIVADYTKTEGQIAPARIAQATVLINNGAEVTLAYSPYGGKIIAGPYNDAMDVYSGKLTLNGGTLIGFFGVGSMGDVAENGATIVGLSQCAVASMGGKFTMTDGVIIGEVGSMGESAELVINGGSIDASPQTIEELGVNFVYDNFPGIQIGGGTALIKKGTIKGGSYGVENVGLSAETEITIEKLAVISGGWNALGLNGGTTIVNGGKFTDPNELHNAGAGVFTFNSAYFQTNGDNETTVEGKPIWRNTSGAEFREGYKFFAGDLESAQNAGVSVCHIGGTSYSSLEDALAYANNTSEDVSIIMDNDYILPAGYYTLPSNATLIVPVSNEQGAGNAIVPREYGISTPAVFRKLTLENGVNLDVFGTIEVSGTQYTGDSNQEKGDHTGAVTSSYGQLQLNQGSKITLQNGSVLRAWGYVTGDIEHKNAQHNVPMGEIDARRGSTVYELFQMGDWGNTVMNAMGLLTGDSRFPITQYYIQNIETPVKYHPGAHLIAQTTVSAANGGINLTMCANDIKIIGVSPEVAMFLMNAEADAENTWVRKWYDASKDQQVYEINSGAHIGNLVINLASSPLFEGLENTLVELDGILGTVGNIAQNMGAEFHQDIIMNSGQYVLPITSNFKLHVLTGTLDFTQSTELIPGSELEIDKEATVLVTDQDDPDVREGSLYFFDSQDWVLNASKVNYSPSFDDGENNGEVPDAVRQVSLSELPSAKVNVRGTFDTDQGYVFTSEHGGNIFSSVEDAGTFIFTTAAKAEDYYEEVKISTTAQTNCYPAYLKNSAEWVTNGGDEYVHTGGTVEGQSYCYLDIDGNGGHWMSLEQRGCFTYDDGQDVYYIKPQEYVAVTVNAVWDGENKEFTSLSGNSDHTFSDAAGKGRLFILLTDGIDCQWWEVEAKDNYFHCIHPENDTYYEWDEEHKEWKEVEFTITWKDWDGSTITTYTVPYGTQVEWLSTNPTREKNVDYTYDFTGWSPALGKVTSNVTYTATYEAKQIKYTITFLQDGGMEIERHLLARDEVPVCENEPTRTGYILQWEPAIEPVVGNQTYTATWLPEPPATYTITFKNYDGTVLKKANGTDNAVYTVTASSEPAYDGATPTKTVNSGKEYTYTFAGWKPTLAPATTNATYVAQFNEVEQTYEVKFYDEAGSNILKTENLTYGATPTPPSVSKSVPGHTCTYVWKTLDETKTIETVTAAASYKPVFTETPNKYTVTLRCNIPGACTFTGAGIYDYGQSASVAATPTSGYEFVKWSERSGGANLGSLTVNGDITLTAVVKVEDTDLPGNLELGLDDAETIAPATNYTDVIITSNGVSASSQIINANNITLYGNADFVLQKTFAGSTWYCVAVPWCVDVNGGILLNGTTPAVLGKNIDICYYDGSVRAAQGKVDACWVYMRNLSTKKVLEPGRAYMIALKNSASSITFRKKVQEPLLTTGTSVEQYNSLTGDDADAGWNAIANPSLFHAYVNAGTTDNRGQRYLSESDTYDWFYLNAHQLVVGEPVYVQVPSDKSIVVANGASYAPARRKSAEAQPTSFDVNITAAGAAKYADHLSVSLNEDKEENTYVIGQDLVKFGVSSKVAQMWIDRYDSKLCVNTIAPEGDATIFPLSIFAPKAGDYTIAIEREINTDDVALYLTYNGEAIWNLSEGAYVAHLSKGTDNKYGLRVSARAPQITTGIDEAVVDAKGETRKVLINDQVFIIREGEVYTITGMKVERMNE